MKDSISLDDVEQIIQDPLKFKAKLAIGEDAYTSLKAANRLSDAWNTLALGTISGTAASSTVVASSFFAPSGLLGVLGIGAAVTPIGWVVAATAIGGGVGYSLNHYFKKHKAQQTTIIPKFINTPLDILALGLFELLAPLCVKVSVVDGEIHEKEIALIKSYFVVEWGFDLFFVASTLDLYVENADEIEIDEIATALAKLTKENPDCNYEEMTREILDILNEITHADGVITEHEREAIAEVSKVFSDASKSFFTRTSDSISSASGEIFKKLFPPRLNQ